MNFIKRISSAALISRNSLPLANLRCLSAQPQTELAVPQKDKLYSRLEIELKGIEPEVMKSYAWYAQKSAEHLGIDVGRCYAARKSDKDRWTVLKSVHVHAKHLVSYEVRTYYRFLNFHNLTQSTLETFLEYIQRNLPEGTAMKATKVEIQKLPEHIEQAIQEENNN
ncbi:small ribosomal subunit protein uS10m [Chironomus tepperi]|uniref:small ribosomal subunit protein uS10m n=1 Tax=Chironomus tepperi TaxID=113505 RepID=UPI00391F5646